jgi:hypothetical protein
VYFQLDKEHGNGEVFKGPTQLLERCLGSCVPSGLKIIPVIFPIAAASEDERERNRRQSLSRSPLRW